MIMGDLNAIDSEGVLSDFLEERELSNLVNFPTCFKSDTNPSVIDLIITNEQKSLPNTIGISTGLSDFHGMVLTSMKTTFPKAAPKVMTYRDMKKFDGPSFKADLKNSLKNVDLSNFQSFEDIFEKVLNRHALEKKKVLRANGKPYVTKTIRKAIMKRSELATKYRARPNEEIERLSKTKKVL